MRTLAIFPLIAAGVAYGQPATTPASFEVASVKVSQVPGVGEGRGRGGLKTSPGSVTIQNMPLLAIVRWAYDVKEYQVDGPHWTENQGYDIFAKAAGPAKDPELQAMMRTLLAERFKLVIHREIRELPIYEMTIGRGGHKLKPSVSEGEPSIAGGRGGRMVVNAERVSAGQFADVLSQPLNRPVLDKTGLKGGFDFTIDLMRYIPLDTSGKPSIESTTEMDRDAIIITAVQEQLGLKLAPKRGPIEVILIDSADKIPAEN
jgi:uncharacterized protein (TIGR03435 family)